MRALPCYITDKAADVVMRLEKLIQIHINDNYQLSPRHLAELICDKDKVYIQEQVEKMNQYMLYDAPVTHSHLNFTRGQIAIFVEFIKALLECTFSKINNRYKLLENLNIISHRFSDNSLSEQMKIDFKNNKSLDAYLYWYSQVCNRVIASYKARKIKLVYGHLKPSNDYKREYLDKVSSMLQEVLSECYASGLINREPSNYEKNSIILEIDKVMTGINKEKIKKIILNVVAKQDLGV